jgi:hypothetical protein
MTGERRQYLVDVAIAACGTLLSYDLRGEDEIAVTLYTMSCILRDCAVKIQDERSRKPGLTTGNHGV